MAPPILYPFINGHRVSWASVEIGLGTTITRGVKSADYSDTLTPGKMRGTGPNVIGRSRGEYDAKVSVELYAKEEQTWAQAILALAPVAGMGLGEIAFPLVFQYAELSDPSQVITDTLEGCRVAGRSYSGSEGSDLLTVKFDLDITRLLRNGVALYSASVGA